MLFLNIRVLSMWENLWHHSPEQKTSVINSSLINEVQEELTDIKLSHQRLTQLMNLETWAIVASMDELFPGFWYRFMSNRQLALKKLMQQQKELPKDS